MGRFLPEFSFILKTLYSSKEYKEPCYVKKQTEDYGIDPLNTGVFLFSFYIKSWHICKLPKNKLTIIILGFFAVIVTVFGYVGTMFSKMYPER